MEERKFVTTKGISPIVRLIPIIILMTFYLTTIIIFEFGPQNWPVKNKFELYSYLFMAYSLMFIGYLFSIKNKKIKTKPDNINFFKTILVIFIILLPFTAYGRIGTIIPDVFITQVDFGQAYYDAQKYRIAWPEYIRIILSPALFAVLPLGLYLWNKLNIYVKFTYIFGIIYYLSIDFSRGTNKTIAEFILLIIILGLLKISKKNISNNNMNDISKKRNIKWKNIRNTLLMIIASTILLILFFNIFTLFISSRTTSLYNQYTGTYADLDNILLSFLVTDEQKFGMVSLMSYLSQGYYGLSLALNKPFYFTGGFGYSSFLLNNISELGFEYIKYNSYAYRLFEDNWPTGKVWSSFFVWPASDITFYGVLILMFIIGYILGSTWISSLIGNDYASVVVFSLFIILAFYIPMNNQLFQSGELFVCTWFWLFYWFKNTIRLKRY